MTDRSTLGDRMKDYEYVTRAFTLRRTPVIIRVDGKAFHTFTKRVNPDMDPSLQDGPFSTCLHNIMVATTQALVANLQNAVIGYTQSDEISILLCDWANVDTQQWFGGNIQKMVSISASIASTAFNMAYQQTFGVTPMSFAELAQFDARVFNLPRSDVANYFIWRQQDASRNSVQMLGHWHFSQREMHGKTNSEVQDMLMLERDVNWNDLPTWAKRGTCVLDRGKQVDESIPIFTQDRNYIEQTLIARENTSPE